MAWRLKIACNYSNQYSVRPLRITQKMAMDHGVHVIDLLLLLLLLAMVMMVPG